MAIRKTSSGGFEFVSQDDRRTLDGLITLDRSTGTVEVPGNIAFDTTTLVVDAANNRVGVGTASPSADLHVFAGASGATPASGFDDFVIESDGSAGLSILTPTSGAVGSIAFGDSGGSAVGSIRYSHSTNAMAFSVNGGEWLRGDSSRNFLLGTTSTPTSSAGNICLANGTAPTGNLANGVIIYAEDVTASSELKVRDEAGNVTTLSPHNFSLIPDGPSEAMAWAYYSERGGRKINVDMLALARAVERITGEKLVYEEDA